MIANTRPRIIMISHQLSGPARRNPNSGVFIKNQLKEYKKHAEIFLYAPVDLMPSFSIVLQKTGLAARICELRDHFNRTVFTRLPPFNHPVQGRCVRFASIPPKNILAFLGGRMLFWRLKGEIRRKWREFPFDLIHGQTLFPDGLTAVLLAKYFGCPVIVTARGSDFHSIARNRFVRLSVRWTLQHADAITAVSNDLKQRIMRLGIPESKITVITNGVDLEFASDYASMDIRCAYDIPSDAPIFLFVGSVREVKDPHTLVSAFGLLYKDFPEAHLFIVGDGILMGKLREHARKQNIQNHVHFTGYINHEKVGAYMNACDVFCLSSVREGWPNVLFEAMIFGKPIVATNVGGIPEAIHSEDYGFLVPPEDPEAMAKAMLKAIKKKWNHEKIRRYAYNNTWEKVGEKYGLLYKKLYKSKIFSKKFPYN